VEAPFGLEQGDVGLGKYVASTVDTSSHAETAVFDGPDHIAAWREGLGYELIVSKLHDVWQVRAVLWREKV
jgi:hypothetical protein